MLSSTCSLPLLRSIKLINNIKEKIKKKKKIKNVRVGEQTLMNRVQFLYLNLRRLMISSVINTCITYEFLFEYGIKVGTSIGRSFTNRFTLKSKSKEKINK